MFPDEHFEFQFLVNLESRAQCVLTNSYRKLFSFLTPVTCSQSTTLIKLQHLLFKILMVSTSIPFSVRASFSPSTPKRSIFVKLWRTVWNTGRAIRIFAVWWLFALHLHIRTRLFALHLYVPARPRPHPHSYCQYRIGQNVNKIQRQEQTPKIVNFLFVIISLCWGIGLILLLIAENEEVYDSRCHFCFQTHNNVCRWSN